MSHILKIALAIVLLAGVGTSYLSIEQDQAQKRTSATFQGTATSYPVEPGFLAVQFKPGVSEKESKRVLRKYIGWRIKNAVPNGPPFRECVAKGDRRIEADTQKVLTSLQELLLPDISFQKSVETEKSIYEDGLEITLDSAITEVDLKRFQKSHPEIILTCEPLSPLHLHYEYVPTPKGKESLIVNKLKADPLVEDASLSMARLPYITNNQ